MANQNPSTPVKVPSSAANYTPATLDPDLRSQINSILIRDGHVQKIQEHLLHSLNAHPSNWPTQIQTHALALLRSGEISNFPTLLQRVIEDLRQDTAKAAAAAAAAAAAGSSSTTSAATNGATDAVAVNGKKTTNGAAAAAAGESNGNSNGSTLSLAVPQSVIDEALKITRESLEAVCDIDENGMT
ncbi:hypothetical protein B0T17DRAFT_486374 [Bombardia bombarda]|uniref:Uncharacterized protein n=1 Tax=Bombardia bombarda TaxID=252184 RepID=A0AA40CA02_9PEZI|nr:hypothetical protein B0T17DRAFT_486374 [Bombardia bombarda]